MQKIDIPLPDSLWRIDHFREYANPRSKIVSLEQLFDEYKNRNNGSVPLAIAELIQAIALLGLSRTDFFSKAAIYGGTFEAHNKQKEKHNRKIFKTV